jgi:hypothetical protein
LAKRLAFVEAMDRHFTPQKPEANQGKGHPKPALSRSPERSEGEVEGDSFLKECYAQKRVCFQSFLRTTHAQTNPFLRRPLPPKKLPKKTKTNRKNKKRGAYAPLSVFSAELFFSLSPQSPPL